MVADFEDWEQVIPYMFNQLLESKDPWDTHPGKEYSITIPEVPL